MNDVRCKRCKQPFGPGKLACPTCTAEASNRAYLELQRQYLPVILGNKYQITLVYIPSGQSGETEPFWHLQRIEDIRTGFCGRELKAGHRQDHIKYFQLRAIRNICPRCIAALDGLIETTPREELPPLALTTGPIPADAHLPQEWSTQMVTHPYVG
jgi:hypothetical protein